MLVECDLCGDFVEQDDLVDHLNLHQALQLSLQQSNEVSPTTTTTRAITTLNSARVNLDEHLLVEKIRQCLSKQSTISSFSLCTPLVRHYSQRNQDDARFGCGYRNLQMLLSSQLNGSNNQEVPSIEDLQRFLTAAFQNQFDPDGARHYGYSVQGSQQWIGAVEVLTILYSRYHYSAYVVDFVDSFDGSAASKLIRYCCAYFNSLDTRFLHSQRQFLTVQTDHINVNFHDKPPLYLQFDGHSITIVGVLVRRSSSLTQQLLQVQAGDVSLVVLDPGWCTSAIQQKLSKAATRRNGQQAQLPPQFLKDLTWLSRKNAYQVVGLHHRIVNDTTVILMDDSATQRDRALGVYDVTKC
ncbi:hypothetical protein MP228_006488 [Amoeboaphelidium protococcarum]|nr:hypothetical protein MP228_006488 [Amoeboaphelidium protococcarum]